MSVSNHHGGGLTLQRILGKSLDDISAFIYVDRFANDLPVAEQYAERSVYVEPIWQSDKVRKAIGNTMAASLGRKISMVQRYASAAARRIDKRFEQGTELLGLICPQGANSLYTLEGLKAIRPVKYMSWVMDDHLLKYKNGQWEYPRGVEAVFAKHLREAEHVFVISPVMQQFYKDRFGINSTVLFGSANPMTDNAVPTIKESGPIKIGYFGAVAGWQTDVLQAAGQAITGTDIRLDIYSGVDRLPANLSLSGIKFKGKVAAADVLKTMQQYNALLLPISFTEKFRHMSEFNIATKMSESLASGVPVVAVGPPYAAMIDYLFKNNAAVIITSNRHEDILNGLDTLKRGDNLKNILNNAARLVNSETGDAPMQKRWQQVLDTFKQEATAF
ncbi:glycosyltransferase family 4 protein [Mucilaginibacter pallidiroseus]|uniref:Glycosyltransferase family 4 protein n=1 Tax=Mucilaginibacter pallidiroseus TaxID=2599295 RepID=A0A563U861_9SPHI|nr:glycosyltransferase family 4 protein [Mucilaginibacter pallidiroseus]TWR27571.1 glycosyltransferase family 4 protein [Mucilaginibacter pallidiroseus]